MPRGERRKKKDILVSKINAIDEKLSALNKKVEELNASKAELVKELDNIKAAEDKVAQEAQAKEIAKFMKENKISFDELKEIIKTKNDPSEEA